MRKDTTSTIKRAERFQIILIGEGILVGGIGGLVVLLYRMCLEYAGKWLNMILEYSYPSFHQCFYSMIQPKPYSLLYSCYTNKIS